MIDRLLGASLELADARALAGTQVARDAIDRLLDDLTAAIREAQRLEIVDGARGGR